MTNSHTRLIAVSIALLAGAVAAGADSLEVNVYIAIIIVGGAIFIAEYVRSQGES
jgi:putative Mn2+ efflux pump MntP